MQAVIEQNPRQSVREIPQTLDVSIATVSRHLQSIGKVKKLNKLVSHEFNEHKNIGDKKFDRCFVCVTPMIPFLTELSLAIKNGSFIIILNDVVNVLIAISAQTLSKAKVSSDCDNSLIV